MMWWALLLSIASGQELDDCGALTPFAGPRGDLIADASRRNVNTYGVLNAANRHLKMTDEVPLAGFYEYNIIGDALRVPGESSCGGAVLGSVDLSSLSLGIGGGNEWIRAFYAAAATGYTHTSQPVDRTMGNINVMWVGGYSLLAPALGTRTFDNENGSTSFDYLAGIELSPGPADLTIGYLGSKGLFVSGAEQTTRAFGKLALSEGLKRLPWWMLGIAELPLPDDLKERYGKTKLFGRKMDWVGADTKGTEAPPEAAPFTSFHLAQTEIGGYVNVRTTVRVQPSAGLHHLAGGACSSKEDTEGWFCGEVGVINLPDLQFYGVSGGPRLAFNIEAALGEGLVTIAVRRNMPEVLDIFPYAYNGVQLYILVGGENLARYLQR